MTRTLARHGLILGLLAAIGPFAVDMYLPALPALAADLHADTAAVQMTMTAYFLGFGLSQLVYGPLSDRVGRKPPLYGGLAVFLLASLGCWFAPSIDALIALRALQGVGAASMAVIPRAVVRDLHTGAEAARLMALVILFYSISPMLAPLAGSLLIGAFDWRAVFAAIALAAVAGVGLTRFALAETHPPEHRIASGLSTVLGHYARLLRDTQFLGVILIGALCIASFFTFMANSAFVYIEHFGLTPVQYGLAFSANALAWIVGAQFSARFARRIGLARLILGGATAFAVLAVALWLMVLSGLDSLPVLMAMFFLLFLFLGPVAPSSIVLSLERHGAVAGMAAALGGALQMATGGVVIAIASRFADRTMLPMVATIAACGVAALLLARRTLGRGAPVLAEAAPSSGG